MGRRIFALGRGLAIGAVFISIWTWFLPRWMMGGDLRPEPNAPAILLMLSGGAIMLWCVIEFGWRGLGTPMPLDPPRRLVVSGLYRWVRNPMYVGMGLFLVGEALLLPDITRQLLIMAALAWGAVTIFIVTYEEPSLRRRFDGDYETYCRHVRRWIPRLTPFDKASSAAVQ